MSRPHDTQELYTWKQHDAGDPHAHRGSPWAWIVVIGLVLVASAWWLGQGGEDQIPSNALVHSNALAPATPASNPPRVHYIRFSGSPPGGGDRYDDMS